MLTFVTQFVLQWIQYIMKRKHWDHPIQKEVKSLPQSLNDLTPSNGDQLLRTYQTLPAYMVPLAKLFQGGYRVLHRIQLDILEHCLETTLYLLTILILWTEECGMKYKHIHKSSRAEKNTHLIVITILINQSAHVYTLYSCERSRRRCFSILPLLSKCRFQIYNRNRKI